MQDSFFPLLTKAQEELPHVSIVANNSLGKMSIYDYLTSIKATIWVNCKGWTSPRVKYLVTTYCALITLLKSRKTDTLQNWKKADVMFVTAPLRNGLQYNFLWFFCLLSLKKKTFPTPTLKKYLIWESAGKMPQKKIRTLLFQRIYLYCALINVFHLHLFWCHWNIMFQEH